MRIRVATYNVLHGLRAGDGRIDLAAVRDAVASLDADVVALQEVDRGLRRSDGTDQVAVIAAALGWHGAFAPALLGDPDRRWTAPSGRDRGEPAYGVGLLSRLPLSAVTAVRLPGGGDGRRRRPATPQRPGWDAEPRVALRADVSPSGLPIGVVATHLSYLPWRAVRQLRRAAAAAGGARAVLLGDLNLPRTVVRAAVGRGWAAADGPPTYPAWRPRAHIDHVLVRGGVIVTATVARTGASDHLPLTASVQLDAPA